MSVSARSLRSPYAALARWRETRFEASAEGEIEEVLDGLAEAATELKRVMADQGLLTLEATLTGFEGRLAFSVERVTLTHAVAVLDALCGLGEEFAETPKHRKVEAAWELEYVKRTLQSRPARRYATEQARAEAEASMRGRYPEEWAEYDRRRASGEPTVRGWLLRPWDWVAEEPDGEHSDGKSA